MKHMSEAFDQFVTTTTQALADISTGLDNISVDQAGLLAKIEELLAAGGSLPAEMLEKLTIIRNDAVNLAAKTKGIADAVPEVTPPVEPPATQKQHKK